MTRPRQINNQYNHNHEGNCKACGHKTKAGMMIGISALNKQHEGKIINMCPRCKRKAHAGRNGAKFAIEKLGLKDWAQNVRPAKSRSKFGRFEV